MALHSAALFRWRTVPLVSVVVAGLILVSLAGGIVRADPAADALARMNELSRQAERSSEAMYSAQLDLDEKVAAQTAADDRSAADQAAAAGANAELQRYQRAVDRLAAADYMGGRTESAAAALTAASPQQLIDQLAMQRMMSAQMARAMAELRAGRAAAMAAERASAAAAEQARAAADAAARIQADLEGRRQRLGEEIAAAEAQYAALTTEQRSVLADPGPPPPPSAMSPSPDPVLLASPGPPAAEVVVAPPAGGGAAVVQAALTRVGAPYAWGATGPDAFDCSGLIKWAFLQVGKSLPRSSQALAAGGQSVAVTDLQPGDIVTFYSDASHAGIFIGEGMMVHASTYGTPVKVAPVAWAPIYNARRY